MARLWQSEWHALFENNQIQLGKNMQVISCSRSGEFYNPFPKPFSDIPSSSFSNTQSCTLDRGLTNQTAFSWCEYYESMEEHWPDSREAA